MRILGVAVLLFLLACSPAVAFDRDRDGVSPEAGDCDDWDPWVHPGQADRPDLAWEDTDCDGIDGTRSRAVFVSSARGDDGLSGSVDFPKRTVAAGLAAAAAQGKDVYVTAGTYNESVTVAEGVGIYGGYALDFRSRTTTEATRITGAPQVVLVERGTGVALQLLTLRGEADGSRSAYGVRAIGGATVLLERVTANAGAGRDGATVASAGAPANTARPGATGAPSVRFDPGQDPPTSTSAAGGSGGWDPALGIARTGGPGGFGGRSWRYSGVDDGGTPIPGPDTSTPGSAAAGESTGGGGTVWFGFGSPGRDGANGAAGAGGAGARFAAVAADAWVPPAGETGARGRAGVGGGGGGGGGSTPQHEESDCCTTDYVLTGAGGGGGGGGGDGGLGGRGGESGGGSFALFVADASVLAVSSVLTAGPGGNASPGGAGGDGLPGAAGGPGGTPPMFWTGVAGAGGRGGQGGRGGAGGGGAGGPSVGVYRSGASSAFVSRLSIAAAGAGGSAGDGSSSGEAGLSTAVLTVPGAGTGAADFDRDGVRDDIDACPATPATGGCPVRPARVADSDGDGLVDADDACPATPAGPTDADHDGCPDPSPTPTPTPTPTPSASPTPTPTPTPSPSPEPPTPASTVSPTVIQAASPTPSPVSRSATIAVGPVTGGVTVTLPGGNVFPLEQLASIPIGSVVDARKGQVSLTTSKVSMRMRAGMFQIRRQQQIALVSAASVTRCVGKGIVRSLDVSIKGQASVVAGAATITPSTASVSWTTRDRCDGTFVRVAKGRVTAKGKHRTIVINAGHEYLFKARLFAAKR